MRTMELRYMGEDDDYVVFDAPAIRTVCPTCDGEGKAMHESLRNVSFSREDFDADPDFEEGYFSGAYDVTCPTCGGNRVTDNPDPMRCRKLAQADAAFAAHWVAWQAAEKDRAEYEALCRAEARYGC